MLSEVPTDQREPRILPEYQQVQYFKKNAVPVKPEDAPATDRAESEVSYSKVATEDLSSLTPGL